MKRFKVITTVDAEADIIEAHLWIARDSPHNAALWVRGLETKIASLSHLPRRCPKAPETEAFDQVIRQLLYKSHRVLFTVEAHAVFILHVRHAARNPANSGGA